MPAQTQFVQLAFGQWVQICEYRESRQSLMVQLLGGAAILGFNTNAPTQIFDLGTFPCGIWHSMESGNGPGLFNLSRVVDGELVKQAWFAWIPAAVPAITTVAVAGGGTIRIPVGVTSALLTVTGGGGPGLPLGAPIPNGFTGGGGGGGATAQTDLAVSAGDVLTYSVGAGGTTTGGGGGLPIGGQNSFVSNTGFLPTSVSEGANAEGGGVPGSVGTGGQGGQVVNCVGDTATAGGNGGMGVQVTAINQIGGGGGGGGGWTVSDTPTGGSVGGDTDNTGVAGAGGAFGGGDGSSINAGGPYVDGVAGVNGGGGGGAGADLTVPDKSNAASGGDGWIMIELDPPPSTTPPTITVIEAFDETQEEERRYIDVTLPMLSRPAQEALNELLQKSGLKPHAI
jgi:hypothetical protein